MTTSWKSNAANIAYFTAPTLQMNKVRRELSGLVHGFSPDQSKLMLHSLRSPEENENAEVD